MDLLRRLFRHPLRSYLLPLAAGALLTALALWLRGGLLPLFWADSLETAGGILVLLGLLGLAARLGAFDTLGYAFSTFRSRRRYRDLFDYSTAKKESRSRASWGFMPWITVGAALFLAGAVLMSVLRS